MVKNNINSKNIAILMCTYQGQKFLSEQIDSIINQSFKNWHLYVSDDGSKDETISILNKYQKELTKERMTILEGPCKGFAKNFINLTCDKSIKADFYAFSDQDDIWESNKLKKAIDWLEVRNEKKPSLYCSRTTLIDENKNIIGLSPLHNKKPSFRNALVQNIAGGNTMVFNDLTRSIILEIGTNINISFHDWLVYLIVTGCNGEVFYDNDPSIKYRQHKNNCIGMNISVKGKIKRIYYLLKGQLQNSINENLETILLIKNKLSKENIKTLDRFIQARKQGLILRLINIFKTHVYRQTLVGNIGLGIAAVFNRI